MSFYKRVKKFEHLVLEKENYSKGKAACSKIIDKFPFENNIDDIARFLSTASMCVELPEDIQLHRKVTHWLISNFEGDGSVELINSILEWLNYKIEFDEEDEVSDEARLSLSLFRKLNNVFSKEMDDSELTSNYSGYATYAISVGREDHDNKLIEEAILYRRKVLNLYENGRFPEYYNTTVFVTGSKLALGSDLLDSYLFDKEYFKSHYQEAGNFLNEAANEYSVEGTDFDREYSKSLLSKYASI